MGITRIQAPGYSRPLVTRLALEERRTVKRRCGVRSKFASGAEMQLERILEPQEQVTALEAPNRVGRLEGLD